MIKTPLLLLLLVVLFAGACSADNTAKNNKTQIVATTGMIGSAVKNLMTDDFELKVLMGPGVDPHLYKPTQGDINALANADIIFYNGLQLEGKMVDILSKMSRTKKTIALAETIATDSLLAAEGKIYDPHIWFDVLLWQQIIEPLSLALQDARPASKEKIALAAAKYTARLKDLHQEVTTKMSTIDADQRILITAHDAFGYFGRRYNMKVVGLQGISTVSEFGVKDVANLVDYIVANKLNAIFVESSIPERSIKAVQQGCIDKGWEVAIGGTLYSDALGAAQSGADHYIGMVQSNVNTIVGALKRD
jgi:manganese/zinc/iron transport system substrate-binding protein